MKTVASSDEVIRPIVAVRISNTSSGRSKDVYAMLDSGADTDFVSTSIMRELSVETWEREMTVVTVDHNITSRRLLASFSIESLDGQYGAKIDSALVGDLVTGSSDIPPVDRDCSKFPHLADVVFERTAGSVDMIIGATHAEAWLGGECRMGAVGEPVAVKTLLGWTLVGTWSRQSRGDVAINFLSAEDSILHRDFQRLFMHDFGVVSEEELGESSENRHAIQQLADSIRFEPEVGKYVVGLPWRGGREHARATLNALDSRSMALKRLRSMLPRFRRDPDRKQRIF